MNTKELVKILTIRLVEDINRQLLDYFQVSCVNKAVIEEKDIKINIKTFGVIFEEISNESAEDYISGETKVDWVKFFRLDNLPKNSNLYIRNIHINDELCESCGRGTNFIDRSITRLGITIRVGSSFFERGNLHLFPYFTPEGESFQIRKNYFEFSSLPTQLED